MECAQDSSSPRHRSGTERKGNQESTEGHIEELEDLDHSDAISDCHGEETYIGNELVPAISESEQIQLNSLKRSLSEQEEIFKNVEGRIEMKKQASKDRVAQLFRNFREILEQKENELTDKVDLEYTVAARFIADFIGNIESEKRNVAAILNSDPKERDSDGNTCDEASVEQLKSEVDTSLDIRDDIMRQFHVPVLELNEQTIERVKYLSFGGFHEFVNHPASERITDRDNNAEEQQSSSISYTDDSGVTHESTITKPLQNAGDETPINVLAQNNVESSDVLGATGVTQEAVSLTTAPAEPEESPPPYWQAMGLQGPEEETRSHTEIPSYDDIHHSPNTRLPENNIEMWHSFPIRRQHDYRGPMPVSITWNHGRICIADRTNMNVKFFLHNGQLITEMQFSTELHDVTFLEEAHGEARYLVSCPNINNLFVISIDCLNATKIVRKLTLGCQYSSVCRGPKEQTLIGVELTPNGSSPIVNLFTFTGRILRRFCNTPSFTTFSYLRAVEVFGSYIIILDWRLNSVSVYEENGTPVGEYKGTLSSPLINPLDMTLDHVGNIMILNGEFSNIHIVDLHCNPIEVVQLPKLSSSSLGIKLIAFDIETKSLSVARSNGDIAILMFQNGYVCMPQRSLPSAHVLSPSVDSRRRQPEVLPLVEGMLPSTIENIIARQPVRNRNRKFHL